MAEIDANIAALKARLSAPLVADLRWTDNGTTPVALDRVSLATLGLARDG